MFCRLYKITSSGRFFQNRSCGTTSQFENIPSPKGLPFIGTTLSLLAEGSAPRLHLYVDKRHKQLGPIFKESIGPIAVVFLSEPEHIRSVFAQEGKHPVHILPEAWVLYNEIYGHSRGLFFMDGPEWLHYRRILNGILLKGEMDWIKSACEMVSADLVNHWNSTTEQHSILPNLETDLYNWSLNTIVAVLLGHHTYAKHKNSFASTLNKLSPIIQLVFETSIPFQVFPAKLACKLRLPSWKKFVNAVDTALTMTKQLTLRLLTEFDESDGILSKLKAEKVPESDIVRIVGDLILAAGDTTAYTTSWMLYLLAKNKYIQNELRQTNTFRHVIRETLRLYPVAPFLTRILPESSVVGGYQIPAGMSIVYSLYTSGRNPLYFTNPNSFWPDRWSRENSTTTMQQACIPFGLGARSCIGRRIAEHQLNSLLVELLPKFDLELDNKTEVEMILKMIAAPSCPIRLKLIRI